MSVGTGLPGDELDTDPVVSAEEGYGAMLVTVMAHVWSVGAAFGAATDNAAFQHCTDVHLPEDIADGTAIVFAGTELWAYGGYADHRMEMPIRYLDDPVGVAQLASARAALQAKRLVEYTFRQTQAVVRARAKRLAEYTVLRAEFGEHTPEQQEMGDHDTAH